MTKIKFPYYLIIIAVLLSGCESNDCCEYLGTEKLPKGIYVEKIRTYCGGVHAGEAYTYYVTDSTNFRWKSGVTFENSYLKHEINDQQLAIHELSQIRKDSIINIHRFNIPSLEKSSKKDNSIAEKPLVKKNLLNNEIRKSHFSKMSINPEYGIRIYQSFCKPTDDSSSYINSVYLVKDSLPIQLLVTYDMKQWTKGYDHYNYTIKDSILIVKEIKKYHVIDTIKSMDTKFNELKLHMDLSCQK